MIEILYHSFSKNKQYSLIFYLPRSADSKSTKYSIFDRKFVILIALHMLFKYVKTSPNSAHRPIALNTDRIITLNTPTQFIQLRK